jgi:hypothetical protein
VRFDSEGKPKREAIAPQMAAQITEQAFIAAPGTSLAKVNARQR